MTSVSNSELDACGQSVAAPSVVFPDNTIDNELYTRSLFFLAAMIQRQVAPVVAHVESDLATTTESTTFRMGQSENSSCLSEGNMHTDLRLECPILPRLKKFESSNFCVNESGNAFYRIECENKMASKLISAYVMLRSFLKF
jgi:hypothetical protein